ncbi:MAG: hypothetical protein AB7O24_14200 [Kofleriaceae bacterium]
MKALWIVVIGLVAVGCGANNADGSDDASMTDAASGCDVAISFSPDTPDAGQLVQATALVAGAQGVASYAWEVFFANTLVAQGTDPGLTFSVPAAGEYDVRVTVTVPGASCPQAQSFLSVNSGTGSQLRLLVTPPASANALPYVRPLYVGGPLNLDIQLDDKDPLDVSVVQPSTAGVAAYLRFQPQGLLADAVVEAFSAPSGVASARLYQTTHDVLVIPIGTTALAPRRIIGWTPGTPLTIDGGAVVSGTVKDATDQPISGAWVQLTIGGVPSTLASTDANGAFAVRAAWTGTPVVRLAITPPDALGLPRIEAAAPLDLAAAIDVRYGPTTIRSVGGVHVDYGGAAAANANVTIVGELPDAATITNSGAPRMASGYVRASAQTDGSGDLAAANVPAAALHAVVAVASGDRAVVVFDTSSSVPSAIDAPAMISKPTSAIGPDGAIRTAVLRLIPRGALALAGAPELTQGTGGGTTVTARLASGGSYDARWSDPGGRGGGLLIENVTADSLDASYALPEPVEIHGTLRILGSPNPVIGASIQVLCGTCTGLERDRPIAEVTSNVHGYSVIVPRPSAM